MGLKKTTKGVSVSSSRNSGGGDPAFIYDPKSRKVKGKHRFRSAVIILALVLLAGGSAFAAKSYLSLGKVIQRNTGVSAAGLKGKLQLSQLKGEGEGRINILLLGVGDNTHSGAKLSDTMMVLSIDPQTNDVAMLGIPRDLWVNVPGFGYSKINAAHAYGEQLKKDGGPDMAKKVVSSALGVPIHYFFRTDFTAFKQAVDSVGGVTIDVKQALYDIEYPCEKNPNLSCGFKLKAGVQKMDGATALKYVRCRKGNCGDDFGRAQRQQQVLVALKAKALSAKTLLDPAKLSGLIDTVGDNIRLDLQIGEIQRLIDISKKVDSTKMVNAVLDNDEAKGTNLVRTANIGGASVVVPAAGIGNYTQIQKFVKSIFVDGYIKQENAPIEVQNGTARPGLALSATNLLKGYSYNVISTVSADRTTYAKTQIVDYSNGKNPYTLRYLEKRFGVKATKAQSVAPKSIPQASPGASQPNTTGQVSTQPQITITIGADYKPTNLY